MSSSFTRMGAHPEDSTFAERLTRAAHGLTRMRFPFKAPSLIDKSKPYFSGIRRFGVSSVRVLLSDPFHTLLNLSWVRFIAVFFCTYLVQYIAFAFIYWMQATGCIIGSNGRFSHSLWVSSRVASTLGFDQVHPNPDCAFMNFTVMFQVIASSLVNYMMLGVVFARFSAPFKRASTVRFSKVAVVSRHPSGYWGISMRVANLRKHQILQPSVRMVVTAVDGITPHLYHHEQLVVEGAYKQLTNLELGFPAHLTHVVTPESFLWNLSLLEMDSRMMEVLVFVDGIDAMTSKHMSARIAYSTSDMFMNEQFAPMNLEMRGKRLGLDFSEFDKTLPAIDAGLLLDIADVGLADRGMDAAGGPEVEGGPGLWQLRHMTFRTLTDRYMHLGAAHTASIAAAAVGAGRASDAGGPSAGGGVPPALHNGQPPDSPHGAGDSAHTQLLQGSWHTGGARRGMAMTTSGMPFAVTKASAQEPANAGRLGDVVGGLLDALSGSKQQPSGSGGSTTSQQQQQGPVGGGTSSLGEVNGSTGGQGDAFVALPTVQRNSVTGSGGNAWQQSLQGPAPGPLPPTSSHATGAAAGAATPFVGIPMSTHGSRAAAGSSGGGNLIPVTGGNSSNRVAQGIQLPSFMPAGVPASAFSLSDGFDEPVSNGAARTGGLHALPPWAQAPLAPSLQAPLLAPPLPMTNNTGSTSSTAVNTPHAANLLTSVMRDEDPL